MTDTKAIEQACAVPAATQGESTDRELSRIMRTLREMAARANTARGSSWEHGARSATTLEDAAGLLESLHLGCEIAYKREPTQAEGDAHEAGEPSHSKGECFVAMGGWTGRRCRACARWVWGGPTACEGCVRREERDEARDCGQDDVCKVPPGCQRHWEERCRELVEAGKAQAEWVRDRNTRRELLALLCRVARRSDTQAVTSSFLEAWGPELERGEFAVVETYPPEPQLPTLPPQEGKAQAEWEDLLNAARMVITAHTCKHPDLSREEAESRAMRALIVAVDAFPHPCAAAAIPPPPSAPEGT